MYILKTLLVFPELKYAEKAKAKPGYYDYQDAIEVPLPEGKTFDDVSEWKILDDGRLEYRMRDEDWYRTYQL
jgi:hypothetical protein